MRKTNISDYMRGYNSGYIAGRRASGPPRLYLTTRLNVPEIAHLYEAKVRRLERDIDFLLRHFMGKSLELLNPAPSASGKGE